VLESVEKGEFHVYPVRTLDEGLELLTGARAGDVHAQGTIHHRASERLHRFADVMQRAGEKEGAVGSSRANE
jgi:predicted ATP-dependent protease